MVQLASMDNHVLKHNLFRLIKDATRPADFINCSLRVLSGTNSTRTDEIKALFKAMKYYE